VNDYDDDDLRARMVAVATIVGIGGVLAGLALGFVLDWLRR
jgi:hypothetical protein